MLAELMISNGSLGCMMVALPYGCGGMDWGLRGRAGNCLAHGFCTALLRLTTDANLGGVEKISVSAARPQLGLSPDYDIEAAEIDPAYTDLLDPHHMCYVKGWSRAIAALSVMLCAMENSEFGEASK